MRLLDVVLRAAQDWAVPQPLEAEGMRFACDVDLRPASPGSIAQLPYQPAAELLELWQVARSACLFRDTVYGQWGLQLIPPSDCAAETGDLRRSRPEEYFRGDLVVGRFLGESELLLLRCNENQGDYGTTVVALPIDGRKDWHFTGLSLGQLASEFVASRGKKFWETPARPSP